MSEEFEGIKDIKKLFLQVLGSEVEVIDNLDGTKENVFILLIERLERAFNKENNAFTTFGLDVSPFTDDLWFVVEGFLKMVYGEAATNIIYWYIFDRINVDGEEEELLVEDEETVKISSVKELWDFIFSRRGLAS